MKHLALLVLLLSCSLGFSQNFIFSLDDNPDNPFCGTMLAGYYSAECPYNGACAAPVGFSPSLGCGSDVFIPGPAVVGNLTPHDYVDSFSTNHATLINGNIVHIAFTVDRYTNGGPGSAVNAQFVRNQAAADLFETSVAFTQPGNYVGMPAGACYWGALPTAGTGGTNVLIQNQAGIGLVPLIGPAAFGAALVTMANGGSNVDNMDAIDGYMQQGSALYYTGAPADAILLGYSPADIMVQTLGGVPSVWATPAQIGLDCNANEEWHDSIDALIVFDHPQQNPDNDQSQAEPGVDYALFSLSPGSPALSMLNGMGVPADAGTIFFTTFQGNYGVYLWSGDLDLRQPPGNPAHTRNVDGLDLRFGD